MWDRLRRLRGLPYLVLGMFALVLMLLPMGAGNLFGSDGDWLSQHVAIAESLRQTMLSAHSVLPQWIGLGGGSSIYDFAYYGVLRPDVLLACLVPQIPMKYIISVYAMAGVMASGMLCYKWLKSLGKHEWTAVMGAVLLLSSTCFYQAHHQIMFVNYMPFLILALMGCDRLLQKKKIGMLCISVFLMIVHSFYYSPTGICVIGIYGIWRVFTREGGKAALRRIFLLAAAMLLAVGMGMILLLPTGLDILSTSKDAGSFAKEAIAPVDFQMTGLLYSPYGCGMSLLTLFCLVVSLGNKKRRALSAGLLAVMAIPAVSLVLNGFLYARGKILIPFVPLLVLVGIETLQELWEQGVRMKKCMLALSLLVCLIPALESEWRFVILTEAGIIAAWMIWWMRQKEPECVPGDDCGREAGSAYKFWLILLFPIWVSLLVNLRSDVLQDVFDKLGIYGREDYLSVEDRRQERVPRAQVAAFAEDSDYRMEYMVNNYMNSNVLCGGDVQRTSIYSSISNKTYAKFYYDTMGNAISYNNRVALVAGQNPVFNYFMGVRYLVCKADKFPDGWQVRETYGDYVLAENEDVRPICYGSTEWMDREEFDRLSFPETLAALSRYTVVESENVGTAKSVSGMVTRLNPEEIFVEEDLQRLLSHENSQENIELNFSSSWSNQILVLKFRVERKGGKEVVIYVNQMSNKLSAKSAPYPNGNEEFVYVIDLGAGAEHLKIKLSDGNYKIEDLEVFSLERDVLKNENIIMPESEAARSERFSLARALWLPQSEAKVCQKTIDMPEDGYFVTSYPFRKGYQVLVDGQEVTPEMVNTAFVGVPLAAGKHEVEIMFRAPGFKMGAAMSAGCWLVWVAVILMYKSMKRLFGLGLRTTL